MDNQYHQLSNFKKVGEDNMSSTISCRDTQQEMLQNGEGGGDPMSWKSQVIHGHEDKEREREYLDDRKKDWR